MEKLKCQTLHRASSSRHAECLTQYGERAAEHLILAELDRVTAKRKQLRERHGRPVARAKPTLKLLCSRLLLFVADDACSAARSPEDLGRHRCTTSRHESEVARTHEPDDLFQMRTDRGGHL